MWRSDGGRIPHGLGEPVSQDPHTMYILFDYQIFSLQRVGGISRYFVELAQRLPSFDRSIETAVLAPVHINAHLASSSIRVFGKKIQGFPGKHRLLPRLNRFLGSFMHKHIAADIIHETYYSQKVPAGNCPRVLTVYDMIHERYPQMFTGPDIDIPRYKAAAVARADHVIAISKKTREDLIRFLRVPEEKISVIPLASSFEPPAFEGSADHSTRPFLLYVGLRNGVKNFATLLRAYVESTTLRRDYDLVCAGGGAFTAAERERIRQGLVADRVRYVEVDDVLLKRLYARAHLFVYPSLYEGFGLPLLEAMRCGCPVVCSNTSSMPEIAGDAARYFEPEDAEQMRVVMERVLHSETEREQMKNRGYLRAKLFSWESCIAKTAEVYRRLK